MLIQLLWVLGVPDEKTWPGISKLVRIDSSMVHKAEVITLCNCVCYKDVPDIHFLTIGAQNLTERLKKQQKNVSDSELDLLTVKLPNLI